MDSVLKQHSTHSQAKVKNIEKKIEKTFDLPEGSVQINNPNGKDSHGAQKIGNLRKKYDEE